jgi:hypothetical protein
MNQKQEAMREKIPVNPELRSSEEKLRCRKCQSITYQYLRAANPFDNSQEVIGCPQCYAVDSMVWACFEDGCKREVCLCIKTKNGYRMACVEHLPLEIDQKELNNDIISEK